MSDLELKKQLYKNYFHLFLTTTKKLYLTWREVGPLPAQFQGAPFTTGVVRSGSPGRDCIFTPLI